MQIRIARTGVLCLSAAVILLVLGFGIKRSANPPRSMLVKSHSPLPSAPNSQAPSGADRHEQKVLEQALARKPGHTPVLMNLARMEEGNGRISEAAAHLKQAVSQEPENFEARLELGRMLFQQGDIQGALEQTQSILKAQPGNPDALYNLGAIYGNLGNAARAREYWERLITLAPQSESGKRAQRLLPQLTSLRR